MAQSWNLDPEGIGGVKEGLSFLDLNLLAVYSQRGHLCDTPEAARGSPNPP